MARLTLHFRDHPLRLIPLVGDRMTIGRHPDCEIHIDSLAVEERHARLTGQDDDWRIEPLDSEAPVFVNGERISDPVPLREGDVVRVGKHSLHYSAETEAEKPSAAPAATVTPLHAPRPVEGYLQFLSGSHVGRTIRLDRAMTRIGKTGRQTALVARRRDGYYLSPLEGEQSPELNGEPIGDRSVKLADGDHVRIGGLELQFFLDRATRPANPREKERRFTRVAFPAQARLLDGSRTLACRVHDLSLKGALVSLPERHDIAPGEHLVLEIPLDESGHIRMEVAVIRCDEERLGLACRDIDVDSITHLRRLVELNSGDPELLDRELADLG